MGANTTRLAQRWSAAMMNNYGTPPVALDRGQGVLVWDLDGREYLDFIGGIAVSALGHGHRALVAAVSQQVARLAHTSNLAMHEPGVRLAERLRVLLEAPGAKVFFTNDGTEANECAFKITRLHGRKLDPSGGRLTVVAADNGFHGRTMGSLALTGNPAKREPFEPLPGPVRFVPFGDQRALAAAVDSSVAAVFLEPTQGEAGVLPAPAGYLAEARRLCERTGALLVVDEVQSGIGRTGQWFASLAQGVRPDLITLAKGLGGGLPIGACVALNPAADLFTPGAHGSTFGGNPVSCAAALAVLQTIEQDGLLANVTEVGAVLGQQLGELADPLVDTVRGEGLWWAVQLRTAAAAQVEAAARQHGLLVNAVRPDAIRLAPPLIVDQPTVTEAVRRLAAALRDVSAQLAGSDQGASS